MNEKYKREKPDFGGAKPGGYIMKTKPGDVIRASVDGLEVLITMGKRHISINADPLFNIETVENEMLIDHFTHSVEDGIWVLTKAGEVREGDEILIGGRAEIVNNATKKVKR